MPETQLPRHEFSMFPDPTEQRFLQEASLDQLSEVVGGQPDMLPEFLHELWRIGRRPEIQGIGAQMPHFFYESESGPVPIDPLCDATRVLLFRLRYQYGIDKQICLDYLQESWRDLIEGHLTSTGQTLTPDNEAIIRLLTRFIAENVEESVTAQKMKDNAPFN